MAGLSRVPLLFRLSRRYALRHRGQTLRAVLGLLVATTVLAAGLGMGESIAVSLEEEALAQFGPIDILLVSQQPFDAAIADGLAERAGLANVQGAASMTLTGSSSNPSEGLAEPFTSIRGVSAQEAQALGPLPGGVAEPRAGEVVLTDSLAKRLGAQVGDRIVLRAPQPGGEGFLDTEFARIVGVSNAPQPTQTLAVREDALGLGGEISWNGTGGEVTLTATSPSGVAFANRSTQQPLRLIVEPPIEAGTWTFAVTSTTPVVYAGGVGVFYPPASASAASVKFEATVSGITKEEGRAGITARPTALVPLADLQRALSQTDRATTAYYHLASGDPYRAVAAMEAALPQDRADAFDVRAEKADRIADAREAGAEITGFLLVMGAFTLLAAMLLAFTLFSALVEERRAELGIARALGLTRGEVALSMTLEGALYAAFAAIVGLGLGLLILYGILAGISARAPEGAPPFAMHVSPRTIGIAFAVGTLLPLATIGLASLRFARLDPARAIRGIPDDPKGKRNLGLGFAVALVVLGGLLSISPIWRLMGLPLVLAGVATALASWQRPGWAALAGACAVALVAYTLYTFTAFPDDADELDPITTLGRGAILALGLAAVAVASAKPYLWISGRLKRGERPQRASFVALKYLVARRRPAGLTMAMIALVVVVVTVMGTLFVVFGGTIQDDEAGYQVIGQSTTALDAFARPLPPDLRDQLQYLDFLPRHVGFRQANVSRDGEAIDMEFGSRQYLGATQAFAEHNEYELSERADEYATDRAAWDAVARGEAILFPDFALEANGIHAGDRLRVKTANGLEHDYLVAGGVRSQFTFQTFVAADHVRDMGFPQSTTILLRVREGADPDAVAHRLSDLYGEDGVSFVSVPEEVARISANIQALVLVFEGFLALGLFVGLAATGFLAARAVHERMRDIGTLRALGFEESDVRRAFILEATLTSAIGLVIGILAGLLVAHSIWWREARDQGAAFTPPWGLLLTFILAVLALAALASRGPAKRAAQLPPAIAVRHTE